MKVSDIPNSVYSNPRNLEWDKNGKLTTSAVCRRLPKLHVYVDESGDRNFSRNRQSNFFSMTAVCIPEEFDRDMKYMVGGLRYALKIRKTMHWVRHFRDRPGQAWKRDFLVDKLSQLPAIRAIHVVMDKPNVYKDAHMRKNPDVAYKYASMLLLERIARVAAGWPGGQRVALTRFGVVGGVDHKETKRYLEDTAIGPPKFPTPWENILWPVTWRHQHEFDGLQLADVYSGIFDAAIRRSKPQHLFGIAKQVHQNYRGEVGGYGIKFLPTASAQDMYGSPWWLTFLEHKDA
ncbi:DUF3800 domain-containing protein [Auritidibacter ignavus]|nr:DUF3800 domain-containing protein [Auritidibacter ignavus]WGH87367.1 DUF3800 domain-containing protein [Auritidibacter ignavus]